MVKAETLGTRIWQKSLKESRTSPNQQSYPVSKKSEEDLQKRIENKAYELYEKRGCQPGHEWEDWLEAEKLVTEDVGKVSLS